MKVLTVDIGTGTQDIFLYDSRLDLENGYKLILPSPTMMVHRRIIAATEARLPILLTGHQMGGGPSAWAAEAHARAGLPVYATADAARTLDDELDKVKALGIHIISEQEALHLPSSVLRLELKDFDFLSIANTFAGYGVSLSDLDAIAVAVFDHGAAPAGVSDRRFRFDYFDRRIREKNSLSAFAYLSTEIPETMTRLQAVADSAGRLNCPLIVMDTAPAAILGATLDPIVARRKRNLITNIGNFHTLAFRLAPYGIEGLFEHHTGELDLPKLVLLLRALANSSLKNEDVFNDMGHGALIYHQHPYPLGRGDYDVVVTGPRRGLFNQRAPIQDLKPLRPYFAVPFGDMMMTGCFGLLAATAEFLPNLGEQLKASLGRSNGVHSSIAPWDVD
jgi:uncharacterized protein (DUF1786 family)